MAAAMLLHGIWDAAAAIYSRLGAFGPGFGIVSTIVVALALGLYVFHLSVPRERQQMRDVLAPEVPRGIITDAEVDALSGNRKARKAYRHAGHGHRDHVQARHVLAATHDLADELAAADGADTERVDFARSEVLRLRGPA